MATVALLGTCDTKLEELLFLRTQIEEDSRVKVILIDVGRAERKNDAITISQSELLSKYGNGKDVSALPRGELIKFISSCASKVVKHLYDGHFIHGIIAAGGSGGTSLAAAPMREALPIGFPKLIVSTIASGDTGPLVGETDIMLMYSVVDISGLNQVLRDVLSNAGAAIAAAALSYASRQDLQKRQMRESAPKKRVGITMFGVTTPGVDVIRSHLESNYPIETLVFHATGHGGKAMERLIRNGTIDAVIDLTTTEICDFLTGGIYSAGASRLDAAVEACIPNIVSLGATDMSNFGPISTVPEKYKGRRLIEHNPVTTLMRSSKDECRQIGEFISNKIKHTKRPDLVEVWIPQGGVSMIAVPEGPFADEEADRVLFDTIREGLKGSGVEIIEDQRDVNHEDFGRDIAEALVKKLALV